MTGGIDAAGDIATGALLGRAAEPRAGETGHGDHPSICLNCGAALIGDFCHQCGQAGHIHRSLGAILHDLAHGVLHFEGKIWRTLPMLLFHPGALTRRYIAGERARFVSPLALFLFLVFVMFAMIHVLAGEIDANVPAAMQEQSVHQIDAEIAKAEKGAATAATADDRARYQDSIAGLKIARESIARGGETFETASVNTGWSRLDHAVHKAQENPGLALYKLQMNAYKFSWALIPISVPFVALIFLWRRRYKLYDHAIFVIYSLDFMTLLVIALSLLGAIGLGSDLIAFAAMLLPPIHIYKQLRGAYALSRFSAGWRTIVLLVFALLALTFFFMLMLAMGLMG
ncbi:DUF3667 domain-containing protein [Hephaestia sp. GCM10023244]|uniref:DUF3667 domain-containing protein n=1 Tax=unclassified Hephaestia TaxID=2631281 RepID=UPI0020772AF7|nr:DUF3667 domain-containing protein [Hephaestia sp. MAHUQ-44]MCM8731118.1 DUF3667 domain-containing protein [Hephaestia sp. MAHUQ-44]